MREEESPARRGPDPPRETTFPPSRSEERALCYSVTEIGRKPLGGGPLPNAPADPSLEDTPCAGIVITKPEMPLPDPIISLGKAGEGASDEPCAGPRRKRPGRHHPDRRSRGEGPRRRNPSALREALRLR